MTTQEFKDKIMPHHGAMFRVASAILSDSEEAADAVQDSMMRLWQYRDRLAAVADIRAYCIATTRKVCITATQKRVSYPDSYEALDTEASDDEVSAIEWRDAAECAAKAMEQMSPGQRYVLRLSAYGGFSNAEIAELLGMSQDNVRALLSRGRKRLKQLLSDI